MSDTDADSGDDFAVRMRAALHRSGLSISALSRQTEIGRETIAAAMDPGGRPRAGTKVALRAALDQWWDEDESPPPPPGHSADDIDVAVRFIRYQLERMSDESAERAIQAIFRILAGTDA